MVVGRLESVAVFVRRSAGDKYLYLSKSHTNHIRTDSPRAGEEPEAKGQELITCPRAVPGHKTDGYGLNHNLIIFDNKVLLLRENTL